MFRLIGTLRDADVRAESCVSAQAQRSSQDEHRRIRAEMRGALTEQQAATYAERLCNLFQARQWRRKGKEAKYWRKAPVRKIAVRALNRAWSRCHAYGPSIRDLSLADRHALRKDIKVLRYLAEYFDTLWSGKPKLRFLMRLKSLQDALGLLNDIRMINETSEPDRVALEALDEKSVEALASSEKEWRKLRNGPLFWT